MKKYVILSIIGGTIVAVVIVGFLFYDSLKPINHFSNKSLPVLSSPAVTSTTDKVDNPAVQNNTVYQKKNVKQTETSTTTTLKTEKLETKTTKTSSSLKVTATSAIKKIKKKKNSDVMLNVLLLGDDARNKNEASHTDSIMLVHLNITKHRYNILSIPRDTLVPLPGYGNTKITHASYMGYMKGGQKEAIHSILSAVSQFTGLAINYYAETDYKGLIDIVNTLGGITVNLPYDVKVTYPWFAEDYLKVFTKGTHQINGKIAAELTHERHSVPGGDFGRQQLQEIVLKSIAKTILQPSEFVKYPELVKKSNEFLVGTNMSIKDMISLGMLFKDADLSNVHYYQVAGHGGYGMDPIMQQRLYYFYPDYVKLHHMIKANFEN